MLDTFTMATAGDFRQRYRHSYGYFTVPSDKRKVLVFIQQVDDTVTFVDEGSIKYYGQPDAGLEFEFIPVQKKLFMLGGELLLVSRRPARQWSRGVNTQNTAVQNITRRRGADLTFAMVKAAFEGKPVDALENLKMGLPSFTLSDLFGVVGADLYLYDNRIGTFLADAREIHLDEPLFKQEVADLVERNNLGYRVLNG